jgi:hypothetical protein
MGKPYKELRDKMSPQARAARDGVPLVYTMIVPTQCQRPG